MKFGYLKFSYKNFKSLETDIREKGFITVNIGDYMQSLATKEFYRGLGIPEADTIAIDRDDLVNYGGEKVLLLMNGVFLGHSFPLPEAIVPVFVGFRAPRKVIEQHLAYFRKYQPIGCRDSQTAEIFESLGVSAFTSGCVTLTFPRRAAAPAGGRAFVVYGAGVGGFPAELLKNIPDDLLDRAEFVFQRAFCGVFPLTDVEMTALEKYAAGLLKRYAEEASIVITPLHHAATPCLSMGIPVVLCRKARDGRFSYLEQFLDIRYGDGGGAIDWRQAAPDLAAIGSRFVDAAREKIAALLHPAES